MDYVPEAADYGTAPEVYVSGVKSICQISQGIVRITYFAVFERPDGTLEQRVVLRILRDIDEWLAAATIYREAKAAMAERRRIDRPRIVSASAH